MTTQDKSLRATLENILQPVLKKGIDHRPEIAAIDYLVTLERKAAVEEAKLDVEMAKIRVEQVEMNEKRHRDFFDHLSRNFFPAWEHLDKMDYESAEERASTKSAVLAAYFRAMRGMFPPLPQDSNHESNL